ncbi:hypothetical protein C0991_005281 [Blastosporella zonata]|nr:hypothetical protein C0991_005281 [Blastosporella zonata]
MSDEVSPPQPTSTSEPSYVSQFRLHLAEVRAHLIGDDGDNSPPSFIPPTGYWTSSEKNIFFHSLAVHSRLRPDLVAASIGTKSVVDVCAYIECLDEAIAGDRRVLLPRSDFPGSIEVSNAWVLREENLAENTILLETSWVKDKLLLQREEEVENRKVSSQSEAIATGEGVADENLESWERDRRRCWGQEDALSRLEYHHLKVMETILRDAEGSKVGVEEAQSEDQEAEELGPLPLAGVVKPSDRFPQTSVVSDGMIDPLLLQLSGAQVPDQPVIKDYTLERHSGALPHVEHPHDTLPAFNAAPSPPSPPSAPLVAQPLDYHRSTDGDRETAIDHSSLSPASRRRVQKRLHMRRKRAAQRGEDVIEAVAKLRPGRKTKRLQASKPRGKQSTVQPDELDGDKGKEDTLMDVDQNGDHPAMSTSLTSPEEACREEEVDKEEEQNDSDASRRQRRKKGGMTKPYKIKRDFADKGIDADTLIEGNLGLFHLSTLSRLMTFYKSGYDIKGSNAATSISADTIRLLSAILVEFVTEVVHRSIISREQENSMKAGIKVYHQTSDDITTENVTHVLEMMGMVGLTKEQYFAQLLEDMMEVPDLEEETVGEVPDEEDAAQQSDDDHDDDVDDSPPTEAPTIFPILLPVHREIHPPIVSLPKSLLPRAPTRSGPALPAEDQLMPMETDEEELFQELDDEMDLDAVDQVAAYEYEAGLWKVFGR